MVAAVLSVDPLNVILHVGKTLAYKRKSTLLPPSIHVCIQTSQITPAADISFGSINLLIHSYQL